MDFREIAPFLSRRLLHLILMPTEQCNFRCVYCYEDFLAGEMPRPVVDAVKALVGRRIAGLDLLSIEWFGGEPMLAFPIIEEVQAHVAELGRQHPQVRLAGAMTTNGSLLTRRRFDRLVALGVRRYQISLDGTAESHDSLRQRQGGGATFQAIWRNLLAMKVSAEPFYVLLRLHVTRHNQESVERLLDDIARELGGDDRFGVMLRAVHRLGGPHDAELPVLAAEEEPEVLGRLLRRAGELGFSDRHQDVYAQPGILPGCYASALGSFVVRSSGELAKCTVALGSPHNRVGTLKPDGTVEVEPAKMAGWLRGALTGDREILECPLHGFPASGEQPPDRGPRQLVQIGAPR